MLTSPTDRSRSSICYQRSTGDVEGIGWLEAWGPSLVTALEAWQALAAPRDVPPLIHATGDAHV